VLVTVLFTLSFAFTARAATVVDNALLANESDGANWSSYSRTFSEQRFSPLARINSTNVKRLASPGRWG
jgi:quinohemoprotein ethanol dehydrogenase